MSKEKHHVLIVIPDIPTLDAIGEVVSSLGCIPTMLEGEEEALIACAKEREFAVAIFDWELTQEHFPELLGKLSEISSYMGKFVLINSSLLEIKKHIDNRDFCCYMRKPFDLEKFEEGVSVCIKEFEQKKADCECDPPAR